MSGAQSRTRIDPLGAVLVTAAAAALLFLPFVLFKANRILPGDPRSLAQVLPAWGAVGCAAVLAIAAVAALWIANARARLAAGARRRGCRRARGRCRRGCAHSAGRLCRARRPGGCVLDADRVPGAPRDRCGDAHQPGPALRVLFLAGSLAVAGLVLAHGTFDHLSVMREYAVNAVRFAHEARRHLELAFGSLAAAALAGLPLGVLCHRLPRLRPGILGTLNVIQTIPAIALFGILMAPLGALAAAVPLADRLGIRGIGAAPAVVALFLYSLLPIVANTVAGLKRVSRAAVEAAHGMGMTSWQVLTRVELILALPVILTGVRVVLVQNIGMVTVAALIGGGGLGAFVFQGIGQTAIDLVLLGAIPIVTLAFSAALVLDALVELLDRVRA